MNELIENFKKVPEGYGEVAFYWWLGDKLTKERLSWQLEKLKDHAISGIQINYAHSDEGGLLWGLTIKNDPPLFSEEWWELFGWYMKECQKYGISVSLSDYTLGSAGQGWFVDELLIKYPEKLGQVLSYENGEVKINKIENSFNPLQSGVGEAFNEVFYKRFEEHFPGECGKGLNFFFSDELNFGVRGKLWCDDFQEQFTLRKGYDIIPYLKGIFEEIGDITPKVRLDYYDVIISLSEERFFQQVYQFHEDRNMIFGCDHGGRGMDITEFGDYFRTMKWNQGPGNDQPHLESNLIKNKVSSSIAHLYQRPRTWLEGFYGSGWGTSSEDVADATFRNFAMGHNLLTLHGLYYSTHGGWWEWAPPCNHFRMPYWTHLSEFLSCSERLSYLISQGIHVCDVALVYPVAAMEGNVVDGENTVKLTFEAAECLYSKGIDFDFIDFESIERAEIVDKELKVSGETYKVLFIPEMKTVRYSMMKKAQSFHKAGGLVIYIGALPEASENKGRNDEELNAMSAALKQVETVEEALKVIHSTVESDFSYNNMDQNKPYFLHRRVGTKDIYMVYGVPKGEICTFRAKGHVELWSPWTAEVFSLTPTHQAKNRTSIQMPLDKNEVHLIVFDEEQETNAPLWIEKEVIEQISLDGKWGFELKPTMDNRFGDYRLPATEDYIGTEIRNLSYRRGDEPWQKVSCGYGPRFLKMGPVKESAELVMLEQQLLTQKLVTTQTHYYLDNKNYSFKEYQYSERVAVEGDPGHQGYHGLKAEMSDEFLVMGSPEWTMTSTKYLPEGDGDIYYFWSTVYAKEVETVAVKVSDFKPEQVWLNGNVLAGDQVTLKEGVNTLLLKYKGTGRSFFILESKTTPADWQQTYPLSMQWYNKPGVFAYDLLPQMAQVVGKYQFQSPPALNELKMAVRGDLEVVVDGKKVEANHKVAVGPDGIEAIYKIESAYFTESNVELTIIHEKGIYGGAAFIEPIKMTCGVGLITLGDWSLNEGLYSYSGGVYYRKTITITQEQLNNKLILSLGEVVSSAEVSVNGKKVGIKVAPAWELDISEFAVEGENDLEVLVYNTLSNHYTSIPTRYRGKLKSGLIGPVVIRVEKGSVKR